MLSSDIGDVQGLGQNVRVTDAYLLGNDNMRGFKIGGMGPRDKFTDDALGAKTYGVGSVELTFPLGLPEEFGLRGAVFTDFGTAFGADGNQSLINDSMESARVQRRRPGLAVAARSRAPRPCLSVAQDQFR